MEYKIKIGIVPTRRNIFSAQDAIKYKRLIQDKLNGLNIDYIDIDDINEEGLLFNEDDVV